jgi:hypothetical protein
MWKIISSLFLSSLSQITKDLTDAYKTRENAKTEQERIAANERIAILESRKTSILAAQSDPIERWVRILWAAPFILYNTKLVVWDKVLSLGATDSLSPELYQIQMIVLGGYFFLDGINRFKR